MSDRKKPYKVEYIAFQKYIKGEAFSFKEIFILSAKSLVSLFEGLIRNLSGVIGYKVRYYYYKLVCKKIGKNVLIDIGVILNGPANISIDDYTWIEPYCNFQAMLGEIKIGKRVHIGSYVNIGTRDPVVIEDYVAIGASTKIYSNSQTIIKGKRMSGSMIPENEKAYKSAPIILRKDSFVGVNCAILPGVELGVGAVAGANSVITSSVTPWSIVSGIPAKKLMNREKLNDEEE
jgi:acetyltransferase-like isoleucine patch superfamily enzyme